MRGHYLHGIDCIGAVPETAAEKRYDWKVWGLIGGLVVFLVGGVYYGFKD